MSLPEPFPEDEPPGLVVLDAPTREMETVERPPDETVVQPPPARRPPRGKKAPRVREAPVAKRVKSWTWQFRAPRKSLSTPSVVAITGLLILSALALWALLYAVALSGVQEHRSQRVLQAQLNEQLALQTSSIGGRIKPGVPLARMEIPRLGIHNLVIVEGTTSGLLAMGPGHRRDSPLPGETGASFIMGRGQTFGAPFGHIDTLQPGDPITVETGEGIFSFTVDGLRRGGDRQHLLPGSAARITLVTSVASPVKHHRETLFVDATSGQPAQPPSSGRPTRLASSETYMKGDAQALGNVVAWLAALVAAGAVLAWAQLHWGWKPTAVVAIPVLLALTWGVTETASRLVPNLV
ncbi:MAG: hypothetical protein NVSMB32_12550 [Actinomycetota bacterium]